MSVSSVSIRYSYCLTVIVGMWLTVAQRV